MVLPPPPPVPLTPVPCPGDLHADALLMGLYRFLCGNGQTLLYDPALYRSVPLLPLLPSPPLT
jgi:hypothetical protein